MPGRGRNIVEVDGQPVEAAGIGGLGIYRRVYHVDTIGDRPVAGVLHVGLVERSIVGSIKTVDSPCSPASQPIGARDYTRQGGRAGTTVAVHLSYLVGGIVQVGVGEAEAARMHNRYL